MKIFKGILSAMIMFIFGVEVGGFGVWYITMKAINEPRRLSRYTDDYSKKIIATILKQ